jgi:GTP diphosphokinase / guanosine-3',5'-bis(diphosphate) 3'-diphosphatase
VKRKRIAQETMDIFAPLANRLGIWQIKWELEDLAFRYTYPDKFKEIADLLAQKRRRDRENQVSDIIKRLQKVLEQEGVEVEITGRPKHIYSIFKKMLEKGKTFEMMMDLRGVRLIVPDKQACYAALGVIHSHWRPIPHEFDDYIAAPKDNMYQSLHTAVIYDDGKPLEVQIRTRECTRALNTALPRTGAIKKRAASSKKLRTARQLAAPPDGLAHRRH